MSVKRITLVLFGSAAVCIVLGAALWFATRFFAHDFVSDSASHFVLFAPYRTESEFTAEGIAPATAAKLSNYSDSRENFFMASLDARGNILAIQMLPMRPANNQAIPSVIVFQKEMDAATAATALLLPADRFADMWLPPASDNAPTASGIAAAEANSSATDAATDKAENLPATDAATAPQPDPSLIAQQGESGPLIRYRFVADINQDGLPDLILSGDIRSFGNASGHFTVYLNENGGYREIGQIDAHPLVLALEHDDPHYDSHKLWVYLRSNYHSGILGYYEIHDGKLSELKHVDITLAPDGSALGNKLYQTVFSEPHLLEVEISTTSGNTVSWKPLKR